MICEKCAVIMTAWLPSNLFNTLGKQMVFLKLVHTESQVNDKTQPFKH